MVVYVVIDTIDCKAELVGVYTSKKDAEEKLHYCKWLNRYSDAEIISWTINGDK